MTSQPIEQIKISIKHFNCGSRKPGFYINVHVLNQFQALYKVHVTTGYLLVYFLVYIN